MPYELHDVEDDRRFADGLAPNEVSIAIAPNFLLRHCFDSAVRVVEVRDIKISDIVIGKNRRALNPKKVEEVAASMAEVGQTNPITVRPRNDGRFDLVSGGHRIAAKKSLGSNDIRAQIVEGPEIDVRLWGIADDLHRAGLTALEEAERLAEWVKLIEERHSFSRKNVVKRKGGRPEGAVTKAARELPLKGKTEKARRKEIERKMKIASISPVAKAAATDAGLNRSDLEKVAKEGTPEDQVAKVKEIAKRKSVPKSKVPARRKRRKKDGKQIASGWSASSEDKAQRARLMDLWNDARELKTELANAKPANRDWFCEKIRDMADDDNDQEDELGELEDDWPDKGEQDEQEDVDPDERAKWE
jgi:ParB-like chromosome segregation protein Spo0J